MHFFFFTGRWTVKQLWFMKLEYSDTTISSHNGKICRIAKLSSKTSNLDSICLAVPVSIALSRQICCLFYSFKELKWRVVLLFNKYKVSLSITEECMVIWFPLKTCSTKSLAGIFCTWLRVLLAGNKTKPKNKRWEAVCRLDLNDTGNWRLREWILISRSLKVIGDDIALERMLHALYLKGTTWNFSIRAAALCSIIGQPD